MIATTSSRIVPAVTGRAPVTLRPAPRLLAIAALVVTNTIWGTTFVVTKPLLGHVPPLTVAAARFGIALLVLLPLLARTGARPAHGRVVMLMGLTGVFLLYTCQNIGLQYTSATNGALIHGGIPMFTALLAVPFLGERLSKTRLWGITIALAGVLGVIALGNGTRVGLSLAGDVLVLASAVSLAAYLVLGRRAAVQSASPLEVVAGAALYGLMFLAPASGIELARTGVPQVSLADVIRLLFLGAGASALAFVLWSYCLRHLEAGQAALFTNLSPLVGVLVAGLVLDEPVTVFQVGGGVLIVGGVWAGTRSVSHQADPGRAGRRGRGANGEQPAGKWWSSPQHAHTPRMPAHGSVAHGR